MIYEDVNALYLNYNIIYHIHRQNCFFIAMGSKGKVYPYTI